MHLAPPAPGRIIIQFPHSYYRVPVSVWLNGDKVFTDEKYGGEIPVPAGRHTVTCDSRHRAFQRFGEASLPVTVGPGEVVHVFYAPPHSIISKPAIGVTPQKRRFNLTTLGWMGLIAVLVAGPLLAALFG